MTKNLYKHRTQKSPDHIVVYDEITGRVHWSAYAHWFGIEDSGMTHNVGLPVGTEESELLSLGYALHSTVVDIDFSPVF